jgi:hypothetical protein
MVQRWVKNGKRAKAAHGKEPGPYEAVLTRRDGLIADISPVTRSDRASQCEARKDAGEKGDQTAEEEPKLGRRQQTPAFGLFNRLQQKRVADEKKAAYPQEPNARMFFLIGVGAMLSTESGSFQWQNIAGWWKTYALKYANDLHILRKELEAYTAAGYLNYAGRAWKGKGRDPEGWFTTDILTWNRSMGSFPPGDCD